MHLRVMKRIIAISILFFAFLSANAQVFNASADDFGRCLIQKNEDASIIMQKSETAQLVGWPKAFSRNLYYTNARGVCLSDIDGDGNDEIIFGADTAIYAFSGNGSMLWHVALDGIAYYPPSCADIDDDGFPEILMYTRAPAGQSTSYFYIFDRMGNVRDGFPKSYSSTALMMGCPVVADFDGDRQMEIIVAKFGTSQSLLYVYEPDGSVRDGFPKSVSGRFCVTPSVGYDHKSGRMVDSVIILNTTKAFHAFDLNGNELEGFPVEDNSVTFSYQSPLICHTADKTVYVGASHGDNPIFYSLEQNGQYTENWPIQTYGNAWTYTAPTVSGLGADFDFYVFTQREDEAAIHAISPDGTYIDGFPVSRNNGDEGGSEGVTTLMYSTDLSKVYIFGTSISTDDSGLGFVHVYEANPDLSDFHETADSPLRVPGLSFMSAVNLGDVDGNGKLDLVVQSYDQMGEGTDSIHISVFETNYDYNPNFMFGTYKGGNDRCGFVTPFAIESAVSENSNVLSSVFPNPASDVIHVQISGMSDVQIVDIAGRIVLSNVGCSENCNFDVSNLKSGIYFVKVLNDEMSNTTKFIKL